MYFDLMAKMLYLIHVLCHNTFQNTFDVSIQSNLPGRLIILLKDEATSAKTTTTNKLVYCSVSAHTIPVDGIIHHLKMNEGC